MKKTMFRAICLVLVLCMTFSLAACGDQSESIKKAFEAKDYEVTTVDTNNDTAKTLLKLLLSEEQIQKVGEYELILCTNGIFNIALVIKFPSAEEVKNFLTVEKDGKQDASAYDNAKEKGLINGNCMIFTSSSEAKGIFADA